MQQTIKIWCWNGYSPQSESDNNIFSLNSVLVRVTRSKLAVCKERQLTNFTHRTMPRCSKPSSTQQHQTDSFQPTKTQHMCYCCCC